jgi:dihydropteroate synthase
MSKLNRRGQVAGMPLWDRCAVMGVVNVTPDSFSDGGRWFDTTAAVKHGLDLVAQGADLVDVGGESTRPGSDPVPAEVELIRVIPVIERLVAVGVAVSVDTMKSEVAAAALDAGARMVNDVTALRHDPRMAEVVAAHGAALCLMHMKGEPKTMQDDPRYDDVVAEVSGFLEQRVAAAVAAGVDPDGICIDPGIGFGKTLAHNVRLLRELDVICAIGPPVVVGTSRKRFIGAITGREESDRVAGTLATSVMALEKGAAIFRVHDVRDNRDALDVAAAIMRLP